MRYLGGKFRIAKQLAAVIDRVRQPGQLVWDAFCGGLSMSVVLSKNGPVWSTDACVPLIALYRAVQNGWDPPTEVSEETYRAAKLLPDTDPMKAFCGFGCSFGGKWFGGYARPATNGVSTKIYYVAQNTRNFLLKHRGLTGVDCIDFLDIVPRPTAAVLYLDPPYAGTTGYAVAGAFDSARFWQRAIGWAAHTHVFVSEYSCPLNNARQVWARRVHGSGCLTRGSEAVERLFYLGPASTDVFK